jgi:hypothetical protein
MNSKINIQFTFFKFLFFHKIFGGFIFFEKNKQVIKILFSPKKEKRKREAIDVGEWQGLEASSNLFAVFLQGCCGPALNSCHFSQTNNPATAAAGIACRFQRH